MRLRRARSVAILTSIFVAFAARTFASTGPAHLLKDINQTLSYQMGSAPEEYHQLGKITLFRAWTRDTGYELWRTDGTAAGTALVKDIWPGPEHGSAYFHGDGETPFDPVNLGGEVLFMGNDGVHGWELWKSDGTEAGTRMVKEIRPGPDGGFHIRGNFAFVNLVWLHAKAGGLVYFAAHDAVHGFELWRTDGTEAGTFMLKDIYPGITGAFGEFYDSIRANFAAGSAGGRLYFCADDGVRGLELWSTDGTGAGTVLVKDIAPGPPGSIPGEMFGRGGILLFSAMSSWGDLELWRSDGTEAGTALVKDISPGAAPSFPQQFTELNGAVLFAAFRIELQSNGSFGAIIPLLARTDGTAEGTMTLREFPGGVYLHGTFGGKILLEANDGLHGVEFWTSDGTPAGTNLVKDINPGPATGLIWPPLAIGSKLFLMADDGDHGRELWTSDGTEAGTRLAVDLTPGPEGTPGGPFGAGAVCYLLVSAVVGEEFIQQLWSTDGTPAGTRHLRDFPTNSVGVGPGGILLLGADDGSHGFELWRSDGTPAGTVLVKDINPVVLTNGSDSRYVGTVTAPDGRRRILFNGHDGVSGYHLWASDGTAAGTRSLGYLGIAGLYGPGPAAVLHQGSLFFAASDASNISMLWKSDGTVSGTVPVARVAPDAPGNILTAPVECNGVLFFGADDGVHGIELWKSDGTDAGTVLVSDINPGPDSSYPERLFALGDTLYFVAETPEFGSELWKSDGTPAGTVLVKDISPGRVTSFPDDFARIGDKLFLIATRPGPGREPWISDGTEAGTHLLRDIRPGSQWSVSGPSHSTGVGATVYFPSNDGIHGVELWMTDGTEEGTLLVKDLQIGLPSSSIDSLANLNGTLFFTRGSGFNDELWKSDGTEAGTRMVKDGLGAVPYGLNVVAGGLLFTAWDEDHGYELWRSDGTQQGTGRAQDIFPGPEGSRPQLFMEMGNRVFFLADDGAAGEEPWVAHTAILFGQPGRAIEDLTGEVKALHLPEGLEISLTRMLDAAAGALSAGRTTQAVLLLEAFSRYVDALTPRRISEASGGDLRDFAGEIVDLLESVPPAPAPAESPSPAVAGPPRILTAR